MDLKGELSKIVDLQEIDSRIYNLRAERDEKVPALLEKIKSEFTERKKSIVAFENDLKALQLKRKDRELELATKEEGVKKAQAQLYQLKTNKEYQAKLSEIASLKADVSVLEEEVIKVLDAIEGADKKVKAEKELLAGEEKRFKEEEARLKSKVKDVDLEIKGLEDKRGILVKDIDKNVLSKYEHLLAIRSGLAIVPVEEENCGACHMRVTPQTINEMKMYKGLVFCENCVRILYILENRHA